MSCQKNNPKCSGTLYQVDYEYDYYTKHKGTLTVCECQINRPGNTYWFEYAYMHGGEHFPARKILPDGSLEEKRVIAESEFKDPVERCREAKEKLRGFEREELLIKEYNERLP